MDRRSFLRFSGSTVAAGAAGSSLVQAFTALAAQAETGVPLVAAAAGGYGPLVAAGPDLFLPAGFRAVELSRTGTPMTNGAPTPDRPDGMGAFPDPSGGVRLVRNHEMKDPGTAFGAPGLAYDAKGMGGTTTLVFDPATERITRSFVSLGGTVANCNGGPTPWGSWLTCEETRVDTTKGFGQKHGYIFEVPAAADTQVSAPPLRAMGRFIHEAVAVDPATGTLYLTEDLGTCGFFRFVPRTPGRLVDGGSLQMLAVTGRPQADLRKGQTVGTVMACSWVTVDKPEVFPSCYKQGLAKGGATFARGEGCWFSGGEAVFTATTGGNAGAGQLWRFRPTSANGGQLSMVYESPRAGFLKGPDHIIVSPRGGTLFCEDNGSHNKVWGLSPDGQLFTFARHRLGSAEFCGACFSPDGTWLFMNIQTPGITYAITGPWANGSL
jgi:hypothetical protein